MIGLIYFIFIFGNIAVGSYGRKEKGNNGRIDWSGERMIGLIYFIYIFENIAESSYGRKERE